MSFSFTIAPIPTIPKRDYQYYIGPLITIQVENTLFQVPRRNFELSEVFKNMFAMPPGEGTAVDGQSDEQPLHLKGILAEHFRSFLAYLYPGLRDISQNFGLPFFEPYHSESDLVSVLALAKMWCFENIQEVMIIKLDKLSIAPARKLELARIYDIRQWYKPALEDLSRRPSALTTTEMDQVGADLTLMVLRLKEKRMEQIMAMTTTAFGGSTTHFTVKKDIIDKATDSLLQEYVKSHGWDV